ncbi:MAG: aminotransferase class V-fold PLP-dependent enzyme [Lachnospiraceae bacterium]
MYIYKNPTSACALWVLAVGVSDAALLYRKEYGMKCISEPKYDIHQNGTEIRKQEQALAQQFYNALKEESQLTFYGDYTQPERGAIVTLNIADYDSSKVSDELAQRFGIYTRAGAHCAPLMHETFGTIAQGAVRFSFSHFNTMEEVEYAIRAVRTLLYET